jgi:hypothetical protein
MSAGNEIEQANVWSISFQLKPVTTTAFGCPVVNWGQDVL